MANNPYAKPHASAQTRIAHLQACGLQIARPSVAARKIEEIGYERLRIYFLSQRDHSQPGKPFLPGTTYNKILRIYACDTKIRDACFMAIGRFELALLCLVQAVIISLICHGLTIAGQSEKINPHLRDFFGPRPTALTALGFVFHSRSRRCSVFVIVRAYGSGGSNAAFRAFQRCFQG